MTTLVSRQNLVSVALLLAIGMLTMLIASFIPGLSALLLAILIGAVIGNVQLVPAKFGPALSWGSKKLLRLGIVLLGFKLSLTSLMEIGLQGILVLVITVGVTFVGTLLLGRSLSASKVTTMLVATGFSICGASAVAAMSSIVDPDEKHEEDTVQAIALVTIFGTLTMFLLPPLATALRLSDMQAGLWIGASVHEVAQVVAAGGMVSAAAMGIATVTKLGRVVLLAPLVSIVGIVRSRGGRDTQGQKPPLLPLFVLGFLAAVLVRTFIPLPGEVFTGLEFGANWLLASAMLGLGFGVNLRKMIATGWKPLILGALSTLLAVLVSLSLILLLQA
ncbi:MAG: putative sulfate exporter family transporter [Actinobacteria bacterium]|nr:putative sulfate exporter family transporter [Actinomycetota bacterium]